MSLQWRRVEPPRQRVFEFLRRTRRRERWFKWSLLVATCSAAALILGLLPRGRYLAGSVASGTRQVARYTLGLPTPREEIDDAWRRYREKGIAESRRALESLYAEADSPHRRLMLYAGLDPEHGLIRWGNYNLTLLLPSSVFEADERGRSYRLRPDTRSIWLRNLTLQNGVLMFFLVPDRPELAEVIKGTPAIPVESSRQTTNSWGLRGPEPDSEAPLRGIVLGDSFMQGMFIGDRETPPECLRRYLEDHFKERVSILNTGVMGYSPEQYYYSLVDFADRFRPHFVVVSVFTNDFGDIHQVATRGRGDWGEGKYWLDKIARFCLSREWPHVFVPVPYEPNMLGRRRSGYYPGTLSNSLEINSTMFLDPTDDFINAHLERVIEGKRRGRRPRGCPLFNGEIPDGHFSTAGSEVWAASVGRRLVLLLEEGRTMRKAL